MSQQLVRARKTDGTTFEEEYSTPCMFVPLVGEYGWEG
jgi:hypothetical protein